MSQPHKQVLLSLFMLFLFENFIPRDSMDRPKYLLKGGARLAGHRFVRTRESDTQVL